MENHYAYQHTQNVAVFIDLFQHLYPKQLTVNYRDT